SVCEVFLFLSFRRVQALWNRCWVSIFPLLPSLYGVGYPSLVTWDSGLPSDVPSPALATILDFLGLPPLFIAESPPDFERGAAPTALSAPGPASGKLRNFGKSLEGSLASWAVSCIIIIDPSRRDNAERLRVGCPRVAISII